MIHTTSFFVLCQVVNCVLLILAVLIYDFLKKLCVDIVIYLCTLYTFSAVNINFLIFVCEKCVKDV